MQSPYLAWATPTLTPLLGTVCSSNFGGLIKLVDSHESSISMSKLMNLCHKLIRYCSSGNSDFFLQSSGNSDFFPTP
ncbi:hypothetical protein LINPERPRIM_LOCUS22321 [Linum perenne]